MSKRYVLGTIVLTLFVGAVVTTAPAGAQEVWPGTDFFFEKADWADWTQPDNQDRITDIVWITRANTQGIFNIFSETGYQDWYSPEDTEWATGEAANWPALAFDTWEDWHGSYPPGTLGVEAVVHLITDDIYIDILFVSWTSGGQGGGFSYFRASDPSVAAEATTWSGVKALYR